MNIATEVVSLARHLAHAGYATDSLAHHVAVAWRAHWGTLPSWQRKYHGKATYDRSARTCYEWRDEARADFRAWLETDYVQQHLAAYLVSVSHDVERATAWAERFAQRTAAKLAELRAQRWAQQ